MSGANVEVKEFEAEHLEDDELEQFHKSFNFFDKNKDGTIQAKEIGLAMRSLGENPTDSELQEMINEIDLNGNGTIDFSEFVHLMSRKWTDVEAEMELNKIAFCTFDQDCNGLISSEELRDMMNSVGENISDEEMDELIKIADKDGDGQINFEEFSVLMMGSYRHRYELDEK